MLFVLEPKGLQLKARLAREAFALNGPPDAPLLPIGHDEREDTKRQGPLAKIVGLYARSLETGNTTCRSIHCLMITLEV